MIVASANPASAGSAAVEAVTAAPAPIPEPPLVVVAPKPAPPPPPPQVPRSVLTQSSLTGLSARGSLSTVVVRRALERTLPEISACVRRAAVSSLTPTQTLRATFTVDENRRASNIAVTGNAAAPLATCVSRALADVRTADAPDVGTVSVSLDIGFAAGPT